MEVADEIEYLKREIRRMLARVPSSVNGGSYNKASAYKQAAGDATKEAAKSRPNLARLKQAHNALATYY